MIIRYHCKESHETPPAFIIDRFLMPCICRRCRGGLRTQQWTADHPATGAANLVARVHLEHARDLTDYSLWASGNFTTFNSWNDDNAEKKLGWTMAWSRWIKTDGSNPLTNNEKTQHLSELVSLQYGDELNQSMPEPSTRAH